MTNLFIAEKPSVARALAQALSSSYSNENGFYKGNNGNIYTYAYGHLAGIKDPEELDAALKEWSWSTLPIILNPADYKSYLKILNDDSRKQLEIIGKLAKSADKIYNFADSGQEGELIFSNILQILNIPNSTPIYRGWTSSIQPDAIRKAYKEAKPAHEYQALRQAGETRALSDYMIGINATRAFTLQAHNAGLKETIRLGRIMTPTLALVYDRHMERSIFSKSKFYPIQASFQQQGVQYKGYLQGERITDLQQAIQVTAAIKSKEGAIQSITDSNKATSPPQLFNLTSISKVANQRHKYKAVQTLKILQSLYERKAVSYPRTMSVCVTEDEIPLMHKAADLLAPLFPQFSTGMDKTRVTVTNKRICNPEKVSDHYAILPEPAVVTDLSDDEKNIYLIVLERFFMQFQPDYQYRQRIIETNVNNHLFKSNYKEEKQRGWKALLPASLDTEADTKEPTDELTGFPNIQQGSVHTTDCIYEERETAPPAAYNDGTLLEVMQNINLRLQNEAEREALKEIGIGTVATRGDTIKKLVDINYLKYDKNTLAITDLGIAIIEMVRGTKVNVLTSPEMTARWEIELDNIRNGSNPAKFNSGIAKFTNLIIEEAEQTKLNYVPTSIGQCPICKNELKESPKTYFCTNKTQECKFFLWKSQYGKNITLPVLNQLLTKGRSGKITLKNVKKEAYKAKLVLQTTNLNGKLELDLGK